MNPPRMVPWWSWRWILPVEIVTAAILIAGGIGVGIANYPIWLGKARMQGAWGESHPARIAAAEQIALHGDAGRAEAAVSVAPAAAASATGAETAAPASSAEAAGRITKTFVDSVLESVNAFLRSLKTRGAIIGGEAWADKDLNTPETIAAGNVLAAVVLGALSPRTRNAQVALYQNGDVDYMVATDAIGMGLNMDVDHVAFASLMKFDGRAPRALVASEVAQIAGRAGRHTADGTFGTTGDELGGEGRGLSPEQIEAIEGHQFEALKALYWRNHRLDFGSPRALLHALERRPERPELMRTRDADDHLALAALAQEPEILRLAVHPEAVMRLWEVCRIPDFRKVLSDAHTRLLGQVYRHLMGPAGLLPTDWVAGQVTRLDRTDGDIDTLVTRIAYVRTWTYISHRPDWLADAGHWRERTREIEDKLRSAGFSRVEARYQYGTPGKISWRLSMKYPIRLLGVTKLFFVIIPFYYLLVYPFAYLLNWLDVMSNHRTGTGLIVKAWK